MQLINFSRDIIDWKQILSFCSIPKGNQKMFKIIQVFLKYLYRNCIHVQHYVPFLFMKYFLD